MSNYSFKPTTIIQCVICKMNMKTLYSFLKIETPLVVPLWLHLKRPMKNRISVPLFSCVLHLGECGDKVTYALSHREFSFPEAASMWVTFCETQSMLLAVVMISSPGGSWLMLASLSKCWVSFSRLLHISTTMTIEWIQNTKNTDQSQRHLIIVYLPPWLYVQVLFVSDCKNKYFE